MKQQHCILKSDLQQEPKPQPPSDNQRAETPAALPIGAPRPSLLKLIAQASKEPAVKGDLGKAVRNLVREVRQVHYAYGTFCTRTFIEHASQAGWSVVTWLGL